MGIIFDKINEFSTAFFCTPGHKGRLCRQDVTEFLDDSFPGNIVSLAEANVARLYKTKHLRFLNFGSSLGIKAAILAVDGDIIVESKSHQAIFEGAELAKRKAFVVENLVDNGLKLPLTQEQIIAAIKKYPSAKAVIITSPDYFGFATNDSVFKAVKDSGKILIVDSAHGASFAFSDYFPKSSTRFADITNLSAHKTLNAFTQTAYLAVNNDELMEKVDKSLKLLGTTSPSYLFFGQLEDAAIQASKADYAGLFSWVTRLKQRFEFVDNDDFSRLVLPTEKYNISEKDAVNFFIENGVMPEKAENGYIIFIVTPFDLLENCKILENALAKLIQKDKREEH